ncbi:ATP-dependent DNA ligase [Candidatus Bathyarchaeota archaeon]|nr:ATP-dependent DNA ligase [Candidatus Bathyarchaeota archaeon]
MSETGPGEDEWRTRFSRLALLLRSLEATGKRKEKVKILAGYLKELRPEEVAPSVLLIVGSIFPEFDPRTMNVGYATVRRALGGDRQATLIEKPLTVLDVYKTLTEVAEVKGPGSRRVKTSMVRSLLSRAEPTEAEFLIRILQGEMRIGVDEGMMIEGVAEAAGLEPELIRRALMMTGDLGKVARIALMEGEGGIRRVGVNLFTPLKPMLATPSYDIKEALMEHGGVTAFEYKFDGARIQIHRLGEEVRIYSRRLMEVTPSLPDIVELVKNRIGSRELILEGEAVAMGSGGRPLPFQTLMRRFTRIHDVEDMVKRIPLRLHLFDILYIEGRLLIDEPYSERWRILEEVCPRELLAERLVTGDPREAEAFLRRALEMGHEGLMAKRLDSTYTPGVRGKGWFKIKPAETLDLVIAAADWGYGRRTGWLSNYHLAARSGGEWLIVGKTFKGLTDEEFKWMTRRLQEIKIGETPHTVYVRPEIVVEVDYNEIQRSPHYRSGFALRFARIRRIRDDKPPEEADTIERVKELYERQFEYKAKSEF